MIAQIISLKSKRQKDLSNKSHRKNTNQIPLYKWDYLWMATAFLLLFQLAKENTNEQQTLKPLRRKNFRDFKLSQICGMYDRRTCIKLTTENSTIKMTVHLLQTQIQSKN